LRVCIAALLIGLLPIEALASAPDLFGQSPEVAGLGGAGATIAQEFDATFHNPAGLAFGGPGTVSIGVQRLASWLQLRGSTRSIQEPNGIIVGLAEPVPLLLGGRLRVGLGVYVLPTTIVRVLTRLPDDPTYPLLENRTQRLVVLPGLAVRLASWLSLGVAANFFAGLDGPASARGGPTRAVETTVYEEIYARAALVAGLRADPAEHLRVALVYRQEFYVPYAVQTRNLVGGNAIDIDVEARGLYTPHELALGVGWDDGCWRLTAEGTYERWGDNQQPYVRVDSVLPAVGSLVPPTLPSPFRDTIDLRLGVGRRLPLSARNRVEVRAGAGFAPAAVAEQTGRQNLLDADKLSTAIGAGLVLGNVDGHEVRLDASASWIHLLPRTTDKVISSVDAARDDPALLADERPTVPGIQISNPGYPSIGAAGEVFSFGLVLTVRR